MCFLFSREEEFNKKKSLIFNIKEEDVKLAPFSVMFFNKKRFFSFNDVRKILNDFLMVDMSKELFSDSPEVNNFCTPFNIENSLFSYYINSQYDPEGFEILSKHLTHLIQFVILKKVFV